MNKRILILVNHDVAIYNFRKELVIELINQGYQVYISSPYGERIRDLINMGCEYIETDISRHGKNPIVDYKLIKFYEKNIKKINPLCVLTYTIKPNIYGAIAARRFSIPCISNITGLGTAVENKSVIQKVTKKLYKYAFKDIYRVFFQNEENMNFFIKHKISQPNKYRLLPGSGVNLDEYTFVEYPNNGIVKFVFISRIMKEKGIDLYLEAAKRIKRQYPNIEFHICGFCEENYEEKLNELESQGIIKYHGMVRDVKEVLKDKHCTVHPTYYPEGLSNVLLESSAMGKPIITTNRSGCKEVVGNENGFIIQEKSLEELVKALDKFINLDYETKKNMGANGRHYMEKKFDRKIVVSTYMDTIKELV